jgi:hypothetical protein
MRTVTHEEILERLGQPMGRNYRCPAHDDSKPSLAVSLSSDDNTLFYCFSGCSFEDICNALGIIPSDCFNREEPIVKRSWDTYEYF